MTVAVRALAQTSFAANDGAISMLQRACACGKGAGVSGKCSSCESEERFGAPPLQAEAKLLQRQPTAKKLPPPILDTPYPLTPLSEDFTPRKNDEEYSEAGETLVKALIETDTGKQLKDDLVGVLFGSPGSSALTIGAVSGAIAGLALTDKELPFQLPPVPLNLFDPRLDGFSIGVIWNGPVASPTEGALVLSFTPPQEKRKKPRRAPEEPQPGEDLRQPNDLSQPAAAPPPPPANPASDQPQPAPQSAEAAPGDVKLGPPRLLDFDLPPGLLYQPFTLQLLGEGLKLELPKRLLPKADEASLQKKLSIGASNDPMEMEADRVADQVLATPAASGGGPPRIQRLSSQSSGRSDAVPESVHRTLGSSGAPLETTVRNDMEARFGHDFSGVRVHTDVPAARSASDVDAHAYTVGSNIVFGAGQYAPGSAAGQRLLAHELTHVVQQGASQIVQRVCTAAATCAAPIAGDPTGFGQSEEDRERPFRERRQRMAPARARSTSHAGRARQLETILTGHDPALRSEVHGIFVDQDLSPGTEAMLAGCAAWRSIALPAADPDPDGFAAASKPCVFIHGILNQQGLKFNNGNATVGGRPRDVWRDDTVVTMTHEVQHAIFDNTTQPGLVVPGAVTSPTCTKSATNGKLSEIVAQVSEFPTRFNTAAAEADPAGPAHGRLDNYFTQVISGGESLPGALTGLGCICECAEIDALVVQAVNASTTAFTGPQKTELRTRLRALMPGPGRPIWPSTPA